MFEAFVPSITLPAGKESRRAGGGIGIKCKGEAMLVDGFEGGEPTNGLKDWLEKNGVSTVKTAVLTHVHYDHYHGLMEIEDDSRFHIETVLMYDPLTLKHGCDGSANGKAVKDDMDNAYKFIRFMQARGTKVKWIDKGSTVKCGDTSWKVYRNQPRRFTADDDGNAYAFVNDGSLVLCSPEVPLLFGGDGCIDLEDAIAYFKQIIIAMYVQHHGNCCPESDAKAAKEAGVILMWETNVERKGAGTTGFTMYGSRRVVQAGIPVWMQNEPIYITAASGKIVFRQGSKIVTANIPYQSYQTGWNKDAKGWFYVLSDGRRTKGWAKLAWSKPQSKDGRDWFFFNADGYMVTGFQKCPWSQGTDTFYFDSNGVMQTGWKHIGGRWYYFDPKTGAMKTGWLYDNGSWFYLNADGKMVTGWVTYKGRKCYLEPKSDKNHVQGTCYVNRTAVIDGRTYRFDKNGYATEESGGKSFLNGVDIASYQSGINPAKLTTTDFVIVKFTQGTTYLNPYADRQYSVAKAGGKLLGAYHYAEGKSATAEAQYFVKCLGNRVKECVLALDWEGNQNSVFGTGKDVAWCKEFLDEVYRLTGVRPLIYMSKSVCRKYNWSSVAADYPLWCAQYKSNSTTDYQSAPWTDNNGFGAWERDTIRQYSSHGRIAGYDANIDIDLAYMSAEQWRAMAGGKVQPMTQGQREAIVSEAISHIGVKEGTVLHHKIIDRYNSRKPLPRGYAVKYTDPWCATFISYLAIVMGYTDIIPVECGCPQMITIAKQMGIWVEDDSYVPKPGDIVLYDWQDSGSGDNTGTADHIGIVEKVVGSTETVIEGNYQDSVKRREFAVNGRYIRGYIVPRYK